jgi:pyrroline-5-carboxylate reductase
MSHLLRVPNLSPLCMNLKPGRQPTRAHQPHALDFHPILEQTDWRMSKLCFIGGGNMARSLIGGMIERGMAPTQIHVGEPVEAARLQLRDDFGVTTGADNAALASGADVWLLAVKPQMMAQACAPLAQLAERPLVISIAAGVTLAQLRRWLGSGPRLLRVMPNTPALVGEGVSALCGEAGLAEDDWQQAEAIFRAVGETVRIDDETLMDAVTAVSGSGPAYFFALIEAMQTAAVAQGLPPATAERLVLRTAFGAAKMALDGSVPAAELRRRVTSPGGTTAAAISAFERGGLADLVNTAVAAATERGRTLAAEQEDKA